MKTAPIALFCYNRPELVRQTLESLYANSYASISHLYVFSDGPKLDATKEQLENILAVRLILLEKQWCGSVTLFEAEQNKGLAQSIIYGVSKILEESENIIVIEDDILLSPYFLEYMNEALLFYKDNNKVFSVGAWSYFLPTEEKSPFFLRYPDSIAWATFRRSWELFEFNSEVALNKLKEKKLLRKFNGFNSLKYFEPMLQQQIEGKIDSWAIRWTATAILNNKLTVFPPVSLVRHMGFTSDSTHEKGVDYNIDLPLATKPIHGFSNLVVEEKAMFNFWKDFILTRFLDGNSRKRKWMNRLKEYLPFK